MNIVILSSLAWEFLWQRPQQVASKLAKKGHNVVFINLPVYDSPGSLVKKLRKKKHVRVERAAENLWVVQLYLPEFRGTFSIFKDSFLQSAFKLSLKKINFHPDLSIFYSLHFVPLIKVLDSFNAKIVYDCVDDILAFPEFNTQRYADLEGELIKASDLCFATSELLCQKIEKHNQQCTYLPNAMDFDHFNAVTKPNQVGVNPEVSSLKHPVVGFVGAIYDWIDTDLICELADAHPEYSILLVGPVSFGKEQFEARQNVKMVGTKPYQSLPTYLANMDVCLIPFKLNDITLASNPIKMYEYLASGKPVVSTALPEIIKNGIGVVYIGNNHEDFIRKVERAVAEAKDETAAFERVDFARKNSWDNRVDVMVQLFKDATASQQS